MSSGFGMNELEPAVEVAVKEAIEPSSHDLHVLLRHRPSSIPRLRETAACRPKHYSDSPAALRASAELRNDLQ
jgi:hypothetical protein